MNIDARSAGPPSFSLALQSPRSCSNCAHYQLRSAPVIAASARWHFRAYVWAHVCCRAFPRARCAYLFNSSRWLRSRLWNCRVCCRARACVRCVCVWLS